MRLKSLLLVHDAAAKTKGVSLAMSMFFKTCPSHAVTGFDRRRSTAGRHKKTRHGVAIREELTVVHINENRIPTEVLSGEKITTKREALRITMSIFDPLGIATPITIQAKRIMQDTWRSGIDWNTRLETRPTTPPNRSTALLRGVSRAWTIQIHTFVDASSSAYAATTYGRVENEHGKILVSLIVGRGKVAPLKWLSYPYWNCKRPFYAITSHIRPLWNTNSSQQVATTGLIRAQCSPG